jgi:hypothetical protein
MSSSKKMNTLLHNMKNPVPLDLKQPDKKLKARGLTVFISDIRNCASQEQEQDRVFQELSNIRLKFAQMKTLSGCRWFASLDVVVLTRCSPQTTRRSMCGS